MNEKSRTQTDAWQEQEIRRQVREGYKEIALAETTSCCEATSCCGSGHADAATQLAQSIGYDLQDLSALPKGANMGLSCGNPVALASLQPGEVVVDLGSGGGFDMFIAGRKVGPSGRAIGVDMTPEMLSKARKNALTYREQTGLDNVEFRLGEIEHLPIADQSVDVVISNCVINLSPRKSQVWNEIARILKPGGRAAVSDLALLQPLPDAVKEMVEALVGCVAGAVLVDETKEMMQAAGLVEIQLESHADYMDALAHSGDPLFQKISQMLPEGLTPSDYVTSLYASGKKPYRKQ